MSSKCKVMKIINGKTDKFTWNSYDATVDKHE